MLCILISDKEINQGNSIGLKFGCWQEEMTSIQKKKIGLQIEGTDDCDNSTVFI